MELVRDFDGKLEKNTGDGILAYFGAGEDDGDAVETLLEYIATVKWALKYHVNPELEDNDVETISISTGSAYDTVSVPHKASSASCFCGLSSVSKRLY